MYRATPAFISSIVFRLGRLSKDGVMNVLRRERSGTADNDLFALLIPLQHGTGPYTEPPANFCRNGYLSLCGDFGLGECHAQYITMVMDGGQGLG